MIVDIGGYEWKVLWVKRTNRKLTYDDTQCLGVTYFDKRRIYLDKGLSKKTFEKTVVHELTHAFLYEDDIDLDNSEDTEETVCNFIEKRHKKILKLAKKIVKAWKTGKEFDKAAKKLFTGI